MMIDRPLSPLSPEERGRGRRSPRSAFMRPLAAILIVLCVAGSVRAARLPTYSLRQCTYLADTVVLAVPEEPISAGRFTVKQVLRGREVKPGTIITLSADE